MDSPTVPFFPISILTMWYLMCLFPHVATIFCANKMDNFMCLLEFECPKRLKVHSQAVPVLSTQNGLLIDMDFLYPGNTNW